MRKILLLSLVLATGLLSRAWAQDRTISGKITSLEDGSGLPGVNVILQGTTVGTITDYEGAYSLSVPSEGGTLVFSFVGLTTQTVEIGTRSVIDVSMESDVTQLSEVVVTALNVKREKKTLGYATQEVKEENLRVARETNLNQSLAGKIAGVQVVSGSGAKFGQAAIRIRGMRGLSTGDPLYVVDGIVINDPSTINMDNVESVNVLKGANASALYGSRAGDGVVVITSKKGQKGALNINLNNTTQFENVYTLPGYQNEYGGGYAQTFNTFAYNPAIHDAGLAGLDGSPMAETYADESWGPKLDGSQVAQWDSFTPGTSGFGKARAWSPNEDNVRDFFETGVNSVTSLNISKADEKYNINATITNQNRGGVLPNSQQDRFFLNLGAGVKLSDKLQFTTAANYNRTKTRGNLFEGYNSIGSNFNQWFQRQLDMDLLKQYWKMPDGSYTSWNMNGPENPTPLYWDNPYTYTNASYSTSQVDNYSAKIGLNYEIIEGLNLAGNFTRNSTTTTSDARTGSGTLNLDGYSVASNTYFEDNYEGLLSYKRQLTDDISAYAMVGYNSRIQKSEGSNSATNGGLSTYDLYTIAASVDRPTATNSFWQKKVRSAFGQLNFGWRETVFIDATYRKDYNSGIDNADLNSTNAFSISGSFVFTELMQNQNILSFGKLRGSISEVPQEVNAYADKIQYGAGTPYGSSPAMAVPNNIPDPGLFAPVLTTTEFGLELGFLENRLKFDASYYQNDASDNIISVTVPNTSGVSTVTVNSGKVVNKGWEVAISGTPIRTANVNWDMSFNIARTSNKIESLFGDLEAIPLGNGWRGTGTTGGWGGIAAKGVVGEEWGQIIGREVRRDDNGNMVVGTDGKLLWDDNANLGNILPDYTGGFFNRISYKNFEFSFTLDWQIGGKFHSITKMFNAYSGLGEATVGNNDKGNPQRDAVADGGGLKFDAVKEDGTPNDIYLESSAYWKSMFALHEMWMYDATFVKMREMRLGYQLPQSLFNNIFIKDIKFSIVATNPWLIHTKVDGIDPSEISGDTRDARNNGSWVESGNLPPTRSIGFDIKIGF